MDLFGEAEPHEAVREPDGGSCGAPYEVDWRHRTARANGQLAVGCYAWNEHVGGHVAYALDVLAVRGDNVATIVSFIGGSRFSAHGLPPLVRS